MNNRILLIFPAIFLLFLSLLCGCTPETTTTSFSLPGGKELPFNTVVHSSGGGLESYPGRSANIQVLDKVQSIDSIRWIYPRDSDRLRGVNYEKSFVVLLFNGYRGAIGMGLDFGIINIVQKANAIYCLAHFDDGSKTVMPMVNSYYQGVEIERSQLTHGGDFHFIVFDDKGNERAKTQLDISQ